MLRQLSQFNAVRRKTFGANAVVEASCKHETKPQGLLLLDTHVDAQDELPCNLNKSIVFLRACILGVHTLEVLGSNMTDGPLLLQTSTRTSATLNNEPDPQTSALDSSDNRLHLNSIATGRSKLEGLQKCLGSPRCMVECLRLTRLRCEGSGWHQGQTALSLSLWSESLCSWHWFT